MGTKDTGNSKRREGGVWGGKGWKLPVGHYILYFGDRINRSPNLSTMQYTLLTNPHMPLEFKIKKKIKKILNPKGTGLTNTLSLFDKPEV